MEQTQTKRKRKDYTPAETGEKICQHCKKSRINRPRKLCWSCYYTPGVKELYPSTSKFARRGVPDKNGETPPPTQATQIPAGKNRVEVLRQRAARGETLWHSDDAREIEHSPCSEDREGSDDGDFPPSTVDARGHDRRHRGGGHNRKRDGG